MRRTVVLLTLALGLAQIAAADPAATVNGEEISQERLQSSVEAVLRQQGVQSPDQIEPEKMNALKSQVLDVLIGQQLLWQDAEKKGIVATDDEVEQAVAQTKSKFPSEQAYLDRIKQSGFTEEGYREDLKRQLSARRYVVEELAKQVSVTDAEIDEFYKDNLERMQRPEQVHARHILIKVAPDADEATDKAAREKIEKVHEEAKSGADFAELAKTHSEGPSAPQGGDLGFFGRGQMVGPFEDAAFALQPGELSDVVRTQFGYHVIKSEERRGGDTASKEEATDQIRDYLKQQKLQERVEQEVTALREAAKVEIAPSQ